MSSLSAELNFDTSNLTNGAEFLQSLFHGVFHLLLTISP
jgi:hypothetical protein